METKYKYFFYGIIGGQDYHRAVSWKQNIKNVEQFHIARTSNLYVIS